MKWAVKVPFEEGYIFVTEDGVEGLAIVLYDTKEEAEQQALKWGGKGIVVEYTDLD